LIERIKNNDIELALIIRSTFRGKDIEFFTPENYSQQLGYMNRPSGYIIKPHVHLPVSREVQFTKEVLLIKSGKVRVDFYTDEKEYIESKILERGDVVLLAYGGHGFEVLESCEIIEVKQGPYAGEQDKDRFDPIDHNFIRYKN
jgi:hypothetical protein